MDNADRRSYVSEAISAYRAARGRSDPGYRGEPVDSIVGDLLTDLRHYCAERDIDLAAKLVSSEVNFNSER